MKILAGNSNPSLKCDNVKPRRLNKIRQTAIRKIRDGFSRGSKTAEKLYHRINPQLGKFGKLDKSDQAFILGEGLISAGVASIVTGIGAPAGAGAVLAGVGLNLAGLYWK